jgi:hypothetical protein
MVHVRLGWGDTYGADLAPREPTSRHFVLAFLLMRSGFLLAHLALPALLPAHDVNERVESAV